MRKMRRPSTSIRVASHIHSEWSYDGKWSLPELAEEFRRRRYDALLVTEHDRHFSLSRQREHRRACAEASDDTILLIPGIEYSDSANRVHILVWGAVPFLGEGLPTDVLLKHVKAHDGVAVLAHPSRRASWQSFDSRWSDALTGIEIWNRKSDGWAPSQRALELTVATGAAAFVGIDFHDSRQMFPLALECRAPCQRTEASILTSLRSRTFMPTLGGWSIDRVTQGWCGAVASHAERARRTAASAYRHLMAGKTRILPARRTP
jgi:hypothetical protein